MTSNNLTSKEAITLLTSDRHASVINCELGVAIRISANAYEIDGVVTARRPWSRPVDLWLGDCFFSNRARWRACRGTL